MIEEAIEFGFERKKRIQLHFVITEIAAYDLFKRLPKDSLFLFFKERRIDGEIGLQIEIFADVGDPLEGGEDLFEIVAFGYVFERFDLFDGFVQVPLTA